MEKMDYHQKYNRNIACSICTYTCEKIFKVRIVKSKLILICEWEYKTLLEWNRVIDDAVTAP